MSDVKITERGWAGHYCAASMCGFRRNTLIEVGRKRVVVSTVGNMRDEVPALRQIGCGRYYETMAFRAKKAGVYWEADVTREFPFDSEWAISELEFETDLAADAMHEKVVAEIVKNLTKHDA